MAQTIQPIWGSASLISITLASLANAALRQSASIATNAREVAAFFKIKAGASGVSATGYVNIYVAGSLDNSNFTDAASGSDAAFTTLSSMRPIGQIPVIANAGIYLGGPFNISAAFGNFIPPYISFILQNMTSAALDATEGSFLKQYALENDQIG